MDWLATSKQLLDPYSIKARLIPGLLLVLPALFYFAVTYGPQDPTLTIALSLLGSCGVPYLLSGIVRSHGLRAQERLVKNWGGMPTTLLLRHSNSRLPSKLKHQYHEIIADLYGIPMPSEKIERSSPEFSDDCYLTATKYLLAATRQRDDFPLIHKELASYGFARNCYGIRWLGLITSTVVLFKIAIDVGLLSSGTVDGFSHSVSQISLSTAIIALASFFMVYVWLIHFDSNTVEVAGYCYGERLLEALPQIKKC
ncbi:MAG TPA: hypothetical protein EYG00_01265 [Alcanivorax sp.]|nr:hypothetical protein [Alcanivorax sp.]